MDLLNASDKLSISSVKSRAPPVYLLEGYHCISEKLTFVVYRIPEKMDTQELKCIIATITILEISK